MSKRYIPTGPTAKGGIGTVVFCKDLNLDRPVAVKFIQSIGEHRRLLDELSALQRIRSKHVVEIFDVDYFRPGSRMGIVEEYIAGEDLTCKLGKVSPGENFLRLLFQMASGLADIHAVGVIHRDIKPSNMIVDADGVLKIVDFNLARFTDEAHTHGFIGTRGYAAPELYSDSKVDFDEKIDIYALAVCAFVLLKGEPLPSDLRARPPRVDEWKVTSGGFAKLGIDKELTRLLDAALSENPRNRPTSAEVKSRAERVLLKGRHRALFVDESGHAFELDEKQTTVSLEHPSKIGSLTIIYDNFQFTVHSVIGEVWANNMPLTKGDVLPGSCVIALGGSSRRDRIFITMDVSHPEVVI